MSLKSKLKNGAVVECRNGNRYIKIDNTLLNLNCDGGYNSLNDYDDNLNFISIEEMDEFDIEKLNNKTINISGYCNDALEKVVKENKWTWERPKEILDEKEKEYLSAVIKPFRDRVEYIIKRDFIDSDVYDICIHLNNTFMTLPYFKGNEMYKNMELNKKYTLEELGL